MMKKKENESLFYEEWVSMREKKFVFLRKFRARLNKFSNFNHKQHNVDDKCLLINQVVNSPKKILL